MVQNTINYTLPMEVHPVLNQVFTNQLNKSYWQADGYIDSLALLYKACNTTGMNAKEA